MRYLGVRGGGVTCAYPKSRGAGQSDVKMDMMTLDSRRTSREIIISRQSLPPRVGVKDERDVKREGDTGHRRELP